VATPILRGPSGVLHRWGKVTRWLNKPKRFDSEAGQSVGSIGRGNKKRVKESVRKVKSKQRQARVREVKQ
jgi:hypothetical protein